MSLSSGKLEPNGTLTAGSMSAAIERALNEMVGLGPDEDPVHRRRMALAIARGVLAHLRDNASSISVTVPKAVAGVGTEQRSPTWTVDLGGWS